MKQKSFLFLIILWFTISITYSQTINLKFTAKLDSLDIPLDSIQIQNLSQGGDTMLYHPDTLLLLYLTTGYNDQLKGLGAFHVQINYPNPFIETTFFNVTVPEHGKVSIHVFDISGRKVAFFEDNLKAGVHKFSFTAGIRGFYFANIKFMDTENTLKMLCLTNSTNRKQEIRRKDFYDLNHEQKLSNSKSGFNYSIGDQLSTIGYYQYHMDTAFFVPSQDTIVQFNFYTQAFVCGVMLLDIRDGQSYNTVKIGPLCWMAENINIGSMILVDQSQTNNGIIEKYCYDDITTNCDTYGGLYQWNETMQYQVYMKAPGICPNGWYVPGENEWKLLEGTVDSQYGVGDSIWNQGGWRGFDAGLNVKSTTGWYNNQNGTDLYGFNALPAGYRYYNPAKFQDMTFSAHFWYNGVSVKRRAVNYIYDNIYRASYNTNNGLSVRCVKDTCTLLPTQANAGPDTLNIIDDSITLMGNNPIVGQGFWSKLFGIGGVFSDSLNPLSLFTGFSGKTYKLVWTISNACGISYDTVILRFSANTKPCQGVSSFIYGGQVYNTIQIGSQCWMKENLNIGTMINGSDDPTNNSIIEKYCYSDDSINCDIYGGLYQWNEMMNYTVLPGNQGICPNNWHIPTDNEWKLLEGTADNIYSYGHSEWNNFDYRGFDGGLNLKSNFGWSSGGNGTDWYEFSALPAGLRNPYVQFSGIDEVSDFWTSTQISINNSLRRDFVFNSEQINRTEYFKEYGLSIRCVMDCWPQPTQSNAGPDSAFIVGDTMVLMGNTPVFGKGKWSIASGTVGIFADSTNPTTIFVGLQGITYELVWTISNSCGSSTDTVRLAFDTHIFICGDTITDSRDSKRYGSTKIGVQCWLSENMNIGLKINGTTNQSNNGLVEKYCYNDVEDSCGVYGGLYMWDEMMQYINDTTTQGICPLGWHIPTDFEWKVMEGTVDSQYGVGDPEWDNMLMRGYDAGTNLKSTNSWNNNWVGTDLFGFNALPGGLGTTIGTFGEVGVLAYFWTSEQIDLTFAWHRYLMTSIPKVARMQKDKGSRLGVRCILD